MITEIPVHKAIITARSTYFRTMLSTEMKEKKESFIEIDDLRVNTVTNIIKFIYTGSLVNIPTTLDEMIELTHASHRYELLNLKELCSSFYAIL